MKPEVSSKLILQYLPCFKTFFGEIPAYAIYISVTDHTLIYMHNQTAVKVYPVSLSKYGMGNQKDSFKTPRGMHLICEKIGQGVPNGGIFKARKYTGENYRELADNPDADLITSRILRLTGLEENINRGANVDSFERWIYIHGTQAEDLIGTDASYGCIRMKNDHIIELFDFVSVGIPVYIGDP